MGNKAVLVAELTRSKLEDVVDRLVSMDEQCMKEMGVAFCTVPWDRGSYTMDLKGKWELSRIAEGGGHDVAGVWIASNTVDDICHTHRVMVGNMYRGTGVAEEMFNSLLDACREKGLSAMTIEVSCLNPQALAFYRKINYLPMCAEELSCYLEKRCRKALVLDDRLEEKDGSRYFVLERDTR